MPTIEHLNKALRLMHGKEEFEHFFNKLTSPHWLELLIKKNIFKKPDNLIIQSDGSIDIPSWGPSRYLARIASQVPDKALQIVLKFPNTDNTRIYEDFIDVAIAIPPNLAIKLTDKILLWLHKPIQFYLPDKVKILIIHFFNFGMDAEALKLSSALLDVVSTEGEKKLFVRNDWEYDVTIKEIYASIKTSIQRIQFLKIVINKLDKAVRIEEEIGDSKVFKDDSCRWYDSIEKAQNIVKDVIDILITSIKNISLSIIPESPNALEVITNELFSQDLPIFSRLALFLLRKNLEREELILPSLLNQKFISSKDTWHEYALLLRDAYPLFSRKDKLSLQMLVSNLSVRGSVKNTHQMQYLFLSTIEKHVKGNLKKKLTEMKVDFGEIDSPEFFFSPRIVAGWSESPIDQEKLNALSLPDIKRFLSEWKPSPENWRASDYSLAQTLSVAVSKRSLQFSKNIDTFKINRIEYVKAIIDGFFMVLSNKQIFAWKPVINYLMWAIDNFKTSDIKDVSVRLIEKGFFNQNGMLLPLSLRKSIWKIIAISLQDSDPSYEREVASKDKDYYHIAINSTRGKALECAIQYGLWLKKIKKIKEGAVFEKKCPELTEVLDAHLDETIEKSIAVHSVYGRYFPCILLLNPVWTRRNIARIFPSDKSEKEKKLAAWATYLLFNEYYSDTFEELEREYSISLDEFPALESVDSTSAETRMACHIILHYLGGHLQFNAPLLVKLYSKASVAIRKYIISFIGRVISSDLSNKKGVDEIIKNSIFLLEMRLQACQEINEYSELSEFGWWAESELLDDNWVLKHINEILKLTDLINPVPSVMNFLYVSCGDYPHEVAEIFEMIVHSKKINKQGILPWRNVAESIAEQLLKTDAHEKSVAIIHALGRKGFHDIGRFLKGK